MTGIYFSINKTAFVVRGEKYDSYAVAEDRAIGAVFNQLEIFLHLVGTFPLPSKNDILAAIKANGGMKFSFGPEKDVESDASTKCIAKPLLNQEGKETGIALILFPYSQKEVIDGISDGYIIKWPLKLVVEKPKADHPAFKKCGPTHHYFVLV